MRKSYLRSHKYNIDPKLKFKYISYLISNTYQALKVKKKVEVLEETGPIPEKKDYGDKVEEPPAKKAKRSGPVKITIPSLSTFQDEEDESEFTHNLGN